MGTTSVTVRPNNSFSKTAPTIVGGVAIEWQNNVSVPFNYITDVLMNRKDQGGYWEIEGQITDTP